MGSGFGLQEFRDPKEPLINKLPLTWIALYAAAVG
jgi:hypothetical protein